MVSAEIRKNSPISRYLSAVCRQKSHSAERGSFCKRYCFYRRGICRNQIIEEALFLLSAEIKVVAEMVICSFVWLFWTCFFDFFKTGIQITNVAQDQEESN